MVNWNDTLTELLKDPFEYVNERKAQYRAKVEAKLDRLCERIGMLTMGSDQQPGGHKLRALSRALEAKIEEIQENLKSFNVAGIASLEELKNRIDDGLNYIRKHLDKVSSKKHHDN